MDAEGLGLDVADVHDAVEIGKGELAGSLA